MFSPDKVSETYGLHRCKRELMPFKSLKQFRRAEVLHRCKRDTFIEETITSFQRPIVSHRCKGLKMNKEDSRFSESRELTRV